VLDTAPKEGRALGRALTLLVLIGLCVGCGTVYTSKENAELIGDFDDQLDFDTPPVMVQAVRPEYPDIARKIGADGVVRLKALILETGEIGKIQIVESASPILVDAAVTALRQSQFMPARKDGEPCCGFVIIPFVFGQEDAWLRDRQGLPVDHSGAPKDKGFVPVEPPEPPAGSIKPAK
jgi:TonB family protein